MPVRKIHLANVAGRDATLQFEGLRPPHPPRPGLPGRRVRFSRYVAATESGTHEALQARFGEDYAQALIDGDPEVDLENTGRTLDRTDTVYLSGDGEVLYASPTVVEVVTNPDGSERERRAPVDVEANVNDERALRWTGRKIPKAEAVRRFAFSRTVQIRHLDGLTYDYLYEMAKELAADGQVVAIGAGERGRNPLVFSTNGTPYRGFLEGRVDGPRYQLLLHLSNMELKRA